MERMVKDESKRVGTGQFTEFLYALLRNLQFTLYSKGANERPQAESDMMTFVFQTCHTGNSVTLVNHVLPSNHAFWI